jgi:hypothetical protein
MEGMYSTRFLGIIIYASTLRTPSIQRICHKLPPVDGSHVQRPAGWVDYKLKSIFQFHIQGGDLKESVSMERFIRFQPASGEVVWLKLFLRGVVMRLNWPGNGYWFFRGRVV